MHARVKTDGDILVVHLAGRLDVETAEPFHKTCRQFLTGKKVVFDFQGLNFVGSSGILPFIETLQHFAENNPYAFKVSGVGTEFKRILLATRLSSIEMFESAELAVGAYRNPPASQNATTGFAAQAAPILTETSGSALASTKVATSHETVHPIFQTADNIVEDATIEDDIEPGVIS